MIGLNLRNRWAVLALLCLARAGMAFQFQSIPPVAGLLVRDLGISYTQVGVLIGLFMAPGIALALPGGYLGARLGDRRMVLGGLTCLALGALLLAVSPNFTVAAASRLLSGVGAVLLNIQLVKITTEWFQEHRLATGLGLLVTTWPLGIALALATLGHVGVAWSWQAAPVISAAWAALAMLAVWLLLPQRAPAVPPPAAAAMGAGSDPRLTWRDLGVASAAGSLWMIYNAGFIVVVSFTPIYLSESGYALATAGLVSSVFMWGGLVSQPLGGVLADVTGRPRLLITLSVLVSAGLVWLIPAGVKVLGLIALISITAGLAPGPIMSLQGLVLRPAVRSQSLGVFFCWYYMGMAVIPPMAGTLRDFTGTSESAVLFGGSLLTLVPVGLVALNQLFRPAPEAAAQAA